jgi:hypothetical protein
MNKYIDTASVNCNDNDKYKVKRTSLSEIEACIGLLYLAAVFKSNRQNLDDLWANDETSMEIFRSTMSLQRFRFLLQCLCFNDRTRSLAMDLVKEHRGKRAACSHFSRELRTKLKQWLTSPAREPEVKRPKLQAHCAIYPCSKNRKTKYMCQKCKKFLCLQHVIPFLQIL